MSDPVPTRNVAWDASALLHASRCDRLDVLMSDASAVVAGARHVTTRAVQQEVQAHGGALPARVEIVPVDGLLELAALVGWLSRLGSGIHHRGEATVCAWAEVNDALVIMDDGSARSTARTHGLQVHGTLWICGRALCTGVETAAAVTGLVDAMATDGARYPFGPGGFVAWWTSQRVS